MTGSYPSRYPIVDYSYENAAQKLFLAVMEVTSVVNSVKGLEKIKPGKSMWKHLPNADSTRRYYSRGT